MALDIGEAKNSLFGNMKSSAKKVEPEDELLKFDKPEEINTPESEQGNPKWQTLDKVTVLLTTEQKIGLDRIAKNIMKFRSKELKGNDEKERITANTLIRALVENLISIEASILMEVMSSENDVQKWVKRLFK